MINFTAAAAILEASAFEPDSFDPMMERVARELQFEHLFLFRLEPGRPGFIAAGQTLEELKNYVDAGWWQIDDRTIYCERAARPNFIVRDSLAVPEDVRAKSVIYNEFYVPRGITWNAGWRVDLADEKWGFSLLRPDHLGPVSDEEAAGLAKIAPLANRAAIFALQLREAHAHGTADGIAATGLSATVLNQAGRVSLCTSGAEKLFDENFGLTSGSLWAADKISNAGLKSLAQFARGEASFNIAPDCVIRRRDGRQPILVQPLPVRGTGLDALPGARLVLMLTDLNSKPQPASQVLRAVFGLTPRESEVASLIAAGISPKHICESLTISVETVRDHLKSIMAKTDCSRQSELAALLSQLPSGPNSDL